VTLGQAIVAAHARGDTTERNRLMALANDHATVRDLADLLGMSVGATHKHLVRGRQSVNPRSWHGRILLETAEIGPRGEGTPGGLAPRSEPLMQDQPYTRSIGGLRPRDDIEWWATILFVCPSDECDGTFAIGEQPGTGRCPHCWQHDLERVEYVPRRFVREEA